VIRVAAFNGCNEIPGPGVMERTAQMPETQTAGVKNSLNAKGNVLETHEHTGDFKEW
jgi:hypothetical protein